MPRELTKAQALRYELRFYKSRLDDPTLLDRAIPTELGLLAVPVGGKRRGGHVQLDTRERAEEILALLSGREGFPRLRYSHAEECHLACWGDDEPAAPSPDASDNAWINWEVELGRFFGYSEAAIRRFLRKGR